MRLFSEIMKQDKCIIFKEKIKYTVIAWAKFPNTIGEHKLMYTVEFYETADGRSELWDFLEELRMKDMIAQMLSKSKTM